MSDTMHDIAARVAAEHKVRLSDLRAPNTEPGARVRRVAWPRQHAMAEISKTGRYSTGQIGRFFGDRDHTTVIYSVRRYQARSEGQGA